MKDKYEDIIRLPNHRSKKYPPMPRRDRAAQFSPFAALTGYEKAIEETARLTYQKPNLTEELKAKLNAKLLIIEEYLDLKPEITITFYVADERKSGGSYVSEKGKVKKIEPLAGSLTMHNKTLIPLEDIISIEGEIFDKKYS